MKEIRLNDYEEVIHKVYSLSVSYNAYIHQTDREITDLSDDNLLESLKKYHARKRQSELFQYLNELDKETIKVIEAVMYIGRDYPYTMEECTLLGMNQDNFDEEIDDAAYEKEKQIEEEPDTILLREMKELDQGEKESKSIIINRILEKTPLSNYLRRGINILRI